jgi:hypothetical protein
MITLVNLICIAGIVLGLIHRHRAERPITVMLVSLGALVLLSVLDGVVDQVLYGLFAGARGGGGIINSLDSLWKGVAGLFRAAAVAGLVFAVLYDRGFDLFDFSSVGKKNIIADPGDGSQRA